MFNVFNAMMNSNNESTELKSPARSRCSSAMQWLAIAICLFWAVCPGFGATVEGNILIKSYYKDGKVSQIFDFPFQVSIEGRQWLITSEFRPACIEASGSDGSETCSILTFSEKELKAVLGEETAKKAMPIATMINGAFPADAQHFIRVAWLAYGSSAFFSSVDSTNISLPSLWNDGMTDPVRQGIKLQNVKLGGGAAPLPAAIDFIVSTAPLERAADLPYFTKAATPKSVKDAIKTLRALDGKLIAEYRAVAVTNFEGLVFPLEFELIVYTPQLGVKQQGYFGKVRSVKSEKPVSFLPELTCPVSVSDYRFSDRLRHIDEISYVNTNLNWLKTNDPMLQKMFLAMPAHGLLNESRAESPALVRWGFLVFLLLIPALFLMRRFRWVTH